MRIGRSPLRVLIDEKLESNERGFRAGYISYTMLLKAIDQSSMRSRPAEHVIKAALEQKGYFYLGHTLQPVPGEDLNRKSIIYGLKGLHVDDYERSQN